MKSNFDKIKSILKSFFGNNPREFKVVVLCIIGATTFWFLNALNKEYNSTYSYPLEINFNKDKFASEYSIPKSLDLQVSGQGWDLFMEYITFNKKPITFNIDELPTSIILKKWEIENKFNDQSHRIKLEQVMTDELLVNIGDKISKKINLFINEDSIKIEDGYSFYKNFEISPSIIVVSGAKKLVNTINDSIEIPINEILNSDYDELIYMKQFFPSMVKLEPKSININLYIGELVTKTTSIPFQIDSSNVFQDIKISYSIPDEIQVNEKDFIIKFDKINDSTLTPSLISTPKYTSNISILDSVLIIKNNND